MSKMIQIRNVPDHVHTKLKIKAAEKGMSLSEFLLREVTEVAERPSFDEIWTRIKGRERTPLGETAAAAVRAERDAR